jgi:hypothetical protein
VTARQMIKRWLTRCIIDDWIKTKILFWSLNAWITSLNFSNAFLVSECLISSTKRKLKIWTYVDTSLFLIDIKTPFSSRSTISFCRDAMNDDTTDSTVLKIKLATGVKNFLNRPRSRLIDAVSTNDSIVMRLPWDSTIDSADDSIDVSDYRSTEH